MLKLIEACLVSAFIGWNVPQPTITAKVTAWLKSKLGKKSNG